MFALSSSNEPFPKSSSLNDFDFENESFGLLGMLALGGFFSSLIAILLHFFYNTVLFYVIFGLLNSSKSSEISLKISLVLLCFCNGGLLSSGFLTSESNPSKSLSLSFSKLKPNLITVNLRMLFIGLNID